MVLQDVVVGELLVLLQVLLGVVEQGTGRRRRRGLLLLLQDCGRGCHCCGRCGEGRGLREEASGWSKIFFLLFFFSLVL